MSSPSQSAGSVVLTGYLKKLKTLRRKFFVLRAEAPGHPACLEYYHKKKYYDNNLPAKRCISIRSCFNINKHTSSKHKHVISLYTKDDCFCVIFDNAKDLEIWLKELLLLQNGDQPDSEKPRPTFEHIWQVLMQKKGLGERQGLIGLYRLCLTDNYISLFKIGAQYDKLQDPFTFPLTCIRRTGVINSIYYIEVGRSVVTGGGEFWMEVEDDNIAQNMCQVINNATAKCALKDEGPKPRLRSSSANEASKPISVLQRRHTTQKLNNFSPIGFTEEQKLSKDQIESLQKKNMTATSLSPCSQAIINPSSATTSNSHLIGMPAVRDRCDSLPSQTCTTILSQLSNNFSPLNSISVSQSQKQRTSQSIPTHMGRPHSMHNKVMSYSPPVSSTFISQGSVACSIDSTGSSLSIDETIENIEESLLSKYGHSLNPDEPVIQEENGNDGANQQQKWLSAFKSCSPLQLKSSYVEMCSPSFSSPGQSVYLAMTPSATETMSHSTSSSLVEEATAVTDGYVPMAPVDGYVHMDSANSRNSQLFDDISQHGGSSCSVTSGTPSTDLRFSEYHLDKVTSFLAPGEDLQVRPIRAYSVGSRPETTNKHRRNRLDITQQDSSRVRAFSVGSRSKKSDIGKFSNIVTVPYVGIEKSQSNKSNSAPLLSSSWGPNSINSERMEDLMELDFSRPNLAADIESPHSNSYSAAIDTNSYVDMSLGFSPISTTTFYIDKNTSTKTNQNNSNINNNNASTATQNKNHLTIKILSHKSTTQVPTSLMPVKEKELIQMKINENLEDTWYTHQRNRPKECLSSYQEDYMQMNRPSSNETITERDSSFEGYVDMSFKAKSLLEQDYSNMIVRCSNHKNQPLYNNNCKQKSSLPIAIQTSGEKSCDLSNFLPFNDMKFPSNCFEGTSTYPSQRTTIGSSSTIFPFSLNSPQSTLRNKSFDVFPTSNTDSCSQLFTRKISAPSPLPGVDGCPFSKKAHDYQDISKSTDLIRNQVDDINLKGKILISDNSSEGKQTAPVVSNSASLLQEISVPLSPITKKLLDLTVSKPRLITASPTTSPTPTGFKPMQLSTSIVTNFSSSKMNDAIPTTISTSTSALTLTSLLSPLDTDGYEQLQPGASLLHYASLDLPKLTGIPPVSPTSTQEGFSYAEIDFAKLKQN